MWLTPFNAPLDLCAVVLVQAPDAALAAGPCHAPVRQSALNQTAPAVPLLQRRGQGSQALQLMTPLLLLLPPWSPAAPGECPGPPGADGKRCQTGDKGDVIVVAIALVVILNPKYNAAKHQT